MKTHLEDLHIGRNCWERCYLGQRDIDRKDSVNSQTMSFTFPKIVGNARVSACLPNQNSRSRLRHRRMYLPSTYY